MAAVPSNLAPEARTSLGQVTLVLQGGGALGAFQVGVYQALHEAGVEPDWVIGTSIGAINAALIAGNAPSNRMAAVEEFWRRMQRNYFEFPFLQPAGISSIFGAEAWPTFGLGLPGFFEPNFATMWSGVRTRHDVATTGYYSTEPLAETLKGLIDLDQLNSKTPRLTVGAARVSTGTMHYFDSRDMKISLKHILASGALPPAFPPVAIDGDYYWDGGILSNTPIEAVFDDRARKSGVIFSVHVWNAEGKNPETMAEVFNRQKDIQYASRAASHVLKQKQFHRLRHIIKELAQFLPEDARENDEVQELLSYGCLTRMHIVRVQAPAIDEETQFKDVDFSRRTVQKRWNAGYEQTMRLLEQKPWQFEAGPHEGVILHEFDANHRLVTK